MSSFVRFSEGFSKESTGLLLDASESRDVFHAGAEGRDFLVGVFLVNLALGVAGHLHADFVGDIGFGKQLVKVWRREWKDFWAVGRAAPPSMVRTTQRSIPAASMIFSNCLERSPRLPGPSLTREGKRGDLGKGGILCFEKKSKRSG